MIVVKLMGMACVDAVGDYDLFLRQIDGSYLAVEKIGPAEHLADRVDDGGDVEVAGGHLMEHRREEKKVLAVDQRDFDAGILAESFLQLQRGVHPAESAAEN